MKNAFFYMSHYGGKYMSFVDDLNKRVSYNELLKVEEEYINNFSSNVLNAIKYSCVNNKTKHSLSGYYGKLDYTDNDEIVDDEEYCSCRTLKGTISVDTEQIGVSLKKFENVLSEGIKELGFTQYQIEVKPYRQKIKKKFLGIQYYDYKETNDYIIWVSLKW